MTNVSNPFSISKTLEIGYVALFYVRVLPTTGSILRACFQFHKTLLANDLNYDQALIK
jgi:hypothetical protein